MSLDAPMTRRRALAAAGAVLGAVGAPLRAAPGAAASATATAPDDAAIDPLRRAVADRERAFAATLARRDLAAFAEFVSEEAVFVDGGGPLTGRAAIVRRWAPLFEGPTAPFAWAPDLVVVLASGRLAATTGPVTLRDGTNPTRFQSTWRREDDGAWRVVFDHGYRVCRCAEQS